MNNSWSPQEILDIAFRVEENGEHLYAKLEEQATDEKIKTIWKFLKEQEIGHQSKFKSMLDCAGDYLVSEFGAGDYDAYLEAIAATYIFTPEIINRKTEESFSSPLEAVEFALQIEKESILVYTALKDYILSDKQDIIQNIIKEEKKHVIVLSELKKTLKN
ncbi:MAG: ferritin family protein, partial [Candidatus Omnitrophica bacterium]|nr:ferritin family protein [Candidatus Omnitrophota bacterium]